MTQAFPEWLGQYAALDDDGLAALGNRGLVRRAAGQVEADAVTLVAAGPDAVSVSCAGPAPVTVTLLPGGPARARCTCPVAGVCIHVITACVWARNTVTAVGSVPVDGSHPMLGTVDEVLGWDPTQINRVLGVAAVRRVGKALLADPLAADRVRLDETPANLTVTWDHSPRIVIVAGAGVDGMIVAGRHSEAAERAWKLQAIVSVFAAHGRPWPWPDLSAPGEILPAQREAVDLVRRCVEDVMGSGVSRAGQDVADQLRAAAARARLEALPLLASVTSVAAGNLAAFAGRDDATGDDAVFGSLANAWALATALTKVSGAPPAHLAGVHGASDDAELGLLIPLSARWWRAPNGSRGVTMHLWDRDAERVETVTNGRAAGTDPSFSPTWTGPLLWGASISMLCAGTLRLEGAERRDDGTLSPTSRTRVVQVGGAVDLDELARAVNAFAAGPRLVGFGASPERVRIVRPRRTSGLDALTVDEVAQEVVWELVDTDNVTHQLRLRAAGLDLDALLWTVARAERIRAVVTSGDRPDAVFLAAGSGVELVSLTLTPAQRWVMGAAGKRLYARLQRLREQPTAAPQQALDPLSRHLGAVGDVLLSLAATGRASLTPRQRDTLAARAREAADLGWGSLQSALTAILDDHITPASLLRARFVLARLRTLLEG